VITLEALLPLLPVLPFLAVVLAGIAYFRNAR